MVLRPPGAADAAPEGSAVETAPIQVDRLALPVYGAEHLLQLERVFVDGSATQAMRDLLEQPGEAEEKRVVLPILLRYREGEQLERLGTPGARRDGRPPGAPADTSPNFILGVEVVARRGLFQAASRSPLNPFAVARAADGCASFSEALLRFLSKNGWAPRATELGVAAEGRVRYREEVRTRDMGAFTEAAPTSVRVGEMAAVLRCEGAAGAELVLELEGPGEAVLFALEARVPLLVAAETWGRRAVRAERLPEVVPGRCTDLREVLQQRGLAPDSTRSIDSPI